MKYTTISLTKETHDRLKTHMRTNEFGIHEKWRDVIERLLNHYEQTHPPAAQPPTPTTTPNETALTLANEPPKNTEAD